MVQVGWTSSLSSSYAHEAARVMADAEELGIPVLRYVDDWRSQWLADDIMGHVVSDKGWRLHTERFRAKEYASISAHDKERLRKALAGPINGAPVMVPLMGWGNPTLFDVSRSASLSRVVPFDPQSLFPTVPTNLASDFVRQRRWVLASLQEHDKWASSLGLSWDVLRLGGVKKNPGGTVIAGMSQPVLPEAAVLQHYAESWGVLSPPYLSAGSGYWRTRFAQAIDAGCLIWPGEVDASALGTAFVPPAVVELMSTSELVALADAQAATLDSFRMPLNATYDALAKLVSRV
jgi:hypothetical protein